MICDPNLQKLKGGCAQIPNFAILAVRQSRKSHSWQKTGAQKDIVEHERLLEQEIR